MATVVSGGMVVTVMATVIASGIGDCLRERWRGDGCVR
jgi:hypothetical protein